jgi:hypothetical protein
VSSGPYNFLTGQNPGTIIEVAAFGATWKFRLINPGEASATLIECPCPDPDCDRSGMDVVFLEGRDRAGQPMMPGEVLPGWFMNFMYADATQAVFYSINGLTVGGRKIF